MDFDPDYVGGDEVSIVSGCRILEMLADGTCDERFDLHRQDPANGRGQPRLSLANG
jgi:hypothetical protein